MSRLLSVNVARPVHVEAMAYRRRTAIDKRPVSGPVPVRTLGVDGDAVGDRRYHGGPDQAVYAFAREDLDLWAGRLGTSLRPGFFGENLTTAGIDVNEALIGERWRIGGVLLEVCSVRIPCRVFAQWVGAAGLDAAAWVKRFTVEGRPGPYLRVLEAGTLRAGDPIVVQSRPDHAVTVSTMFRAMTTERSLLPALLRADAAPEKVKDMARAYLAAYPAPLSEGRPEPSDGAADPGNRPLVAHTAPDPDESGPERPQNLPIGSRVI